MIITGKKYLEKEPVLIVLLLILVGVGFFGDMVSNKTFSREDVASIKGIVEGENDGPPWVIYGQLKDGRWFLAKGKCDYTGWDCAASNVGWVASNEETLIRFCMDNDEREVFGIKLN